jgi:hypothetical protein
MWFSFSDLQTPSLRGIFVGQEKKSEFTGGVQSFHQGCHNRCDSPVTV